MKNTELEIKNVPARHPDLLKLIEQLDRYLYQLYPADEVFGLDLVTVAEEDVSFVLAYLEGAPVGCGAIKRLDEQIMELKRFFVEPSVRNRGIAAKMLHALEMESERNGALQLRLETGNQQIEAIRFYRKNGYIEIPCFGEYANCLSSICMEKRLRAGE